MKRVIATLGFALAAIGLAAPIHAQAQAYPTKQPVRMLVPFAAGGAVDTLGRMMADALASSTGGAFVVDNRPGAGGLIAMNAVATAAPDGYTLGVGSSGTLTIGPTLFPAMNFDPTQDVVPVSWFATSAAVLVVRKDLPVNNLQDLIELSKKTSGGLNMASAGTGSIIHLMGEYFQSIAGVKWTHVPYKGSVPALTDLLAGRVDVMVDSVPASAQHIRSGGIRALGVTTPRRAAQLPDVPTLDEAGMKGFDVSILYGVVAPKGTPTNVIATLNSALNKALEDPAVQKRLVDSGYEAEGGPPSHLGDRVRDDLERWRKVITDADVKVTQ